MSSETTTNNPPLNPFSGGDKDDDGVRFDAFSLSPSNATASSPMPSLQSIQQQEQQLNNQLPPTSQPQELKFENSLPSPMEMSGPMNDTTSKSSSTTTSNISYTTQPLTSSNDNINNTSNNNQNNQSFLSKLLSCGGLCSIQVLQPYFDIDTADVFVRIKGSIQYVLVMDGFRNEVLYSDNAFRLAYRDTSGSGSGEGNGGEGADGSEAKAAATTTLPALQPQQTTSSSGKGPDLYGPIWLTMTLVFFVAVTSNISLYIHHTKKNKSIVDEGGEAAEEEWDYDINQLLHATWILYTFTLGLPTLLYFLLRLVGSGNSSSSLGLVELICLYGYSLVPYLPVAWLCIIPYSWVQWLLLSVSTVLSGMLVLRNIAGSIISSGGGGMVGGLQGKGGGMIMCVVGFHFVFFLIMKIAFYHHH